MVNKYHRQIALLDIMINNWNVLSQQKIERGYNAYINGQQFDLRQGLCINAELYNIEVNTLNNAFASWSDFSGQISYPVGGQKEYLSNENKFTVERLRLAKHVRSHLMLAGTPKPDAESIISKFFESNFNAGVVAIAIIGLIIYTVLSKI